MSSLSSNELAVLFLGIATLLAAARLLGELANRFHQPAVLGEILAGVILGPTVLGAVWPELHAAVFLPRGNIAVALEWFTTLSIALFLLVAGMEADFSAVWRLRKTAVVISLGGLLAPFALGFSAAWLAPGLLGRAPGSDRLVFALFMATALAISALPVIVKILMDLGIYQSDLGMIVVSAAMVNDLAGWLIFAFLLSLMGTNGSGLGIGLTIVLALGFAALMLSAGRWFLDKVLPWTQAYLSWPGGTLGLVLSGALFCAAFTEWIGIQAIFGAFLFGIALGESRHLRRRTRTTLEQFISFFFAPLFFAGIGLKVNFAANFDLGLTLIVILIASASKILGCGAGARLAGVGSGEAWAIGFGMNARGVMEIILGLLALQAGLIGERLFVALVIMALVTSMSSGVMMRRLLGIRKPARFTDFLSASSFIPELAATEIKSAIRELAAAAAKGGRFMAAEAANLVCEREECMPTGMDYGVAVPHARLPGMGPPRVAVGFSKNGVDFNAPDGQPARLIILVLTPDPDHGLLLQILADIGRTFHAPSAAEKALMTRSYTEFLALVKNEREKNPA